MDPEMQKKIDLVLKRVKDPESFRPLDSIGLVKKVTYSPSRHTFFVSLGTMMGCRSCCVPLVREESSNVKLKKDLTAEFEREFPKAAVEFL